MAGLLGHGDSFVLRDPVGIRPVYYYSDNEIVVVASERPAIQTVFDVPYSKVEELSPGYAIITKKNGTYVKEILEPKEKKRAHSKEYIFLEEEILKLIRKKKFR